MTYIWWLHADCGFLPIIVLHDWLSTPNVVVLENSNSGMCINITNTRTFIIDIEKLPQVTVASIMPWVTC